MASIYGVLMAYFRTCALKKKDKFSRVESSWLLIKPKDWVVFLVATILLGSLSVHGKCLREYDILLM